jgi:hypothetical protein
VEFGTAARQKAAGTKEKRSINGSGVAAEESMNYDERMAAVEKREAEKRLYGNFAQQQNATPTPSSYYGDEARGAIGGCTQEARPSMRSEAEQQVGYHRERADKADRAAAFFRENPAFDEFIQLIRAGVIQI